LTFETNAVAERVIRTLRQECLDHVLVLNERHLEAVLGEYVRFYNADRPHRSLGLTPPRPTVRDPCASSGPVVARPVLGGLHHVYQRGVSRTDFLRPTAVHYVELRCDRAELMRRVAEPSRSSYDKLADPAELARWLDEGRE
jgi:hypothetical protein